MRLRVGEGYIVPVDDWCLCHDSGGLDIVLVWRIQTECPLERESIASGYRRNKSGYASHQSHDPQNDKNGLRLFEYVCRG